MTISLSIRLTSHAPFPPLRKGGLGGVAFGGSGASNVAGEDPPCPPLRRGGDVDGARNSVEDTTNSLASQSNRCGWVGGVPWEPKSSMLRTSPWPKAIFQRRLTKTRAVSGLSGET